jgi:predicted SprT family Zn-dependent metalloprotease
MDLLAASALAKQLMKKHRLTIKKWKFGFDTAKRRFGHCDHSRKMILLSDQLVKLNTSEDVEDTILHQIAHALVGAKHGLSHGSVWKAMAVKIGATPYRSYDSRKISTGRGNWEAVCSTCGNVAKRFKDPGDKEIGCATCCERENNGKYSEHFRLTFYKVSTAVSRPIVVPTGPIGPDQCESAAVNNENQLPLFEVDQIQMEAGASK